MPTNRYNQRSADTEIIPAGTRLFRILAADASYAANSFNMNPRPLHDPFQGRFEPTDRNWADTSTSPPRSPAPSRKAFCVTKRSPAQGLPTACG
jgi:hypothetical protein